MEKEIYKDTAKKSRDNYSKSLDDYTKSEGKFGRAASNPVYDVIETLGNTNDNKKRQKWERASALMGLNTLFSAVGGTISALSGVKPVQISNEPFNYAMGQIDRADRNSRDDYNRYYKSKLSEAIRGERRLDKVSDNYLDGLNNIYRDDSRTNIYASKLSTDAERQQAKDRAAMDRLEYSTYSKQKNAANNSSVAREKPETYVKNNNGRRVPIYNDDITKLYQIGKMYEIDKPYKSASSDHVRKREFDVLMQRAYLIYERDKKSMNDSLNSDIKSSEPFTLKIK